MIIKTIHEINFSHILSVYKVNLLLVWSLQFNLDIVYYNVDNHTW